MLEVIVDVKEMVKRSAHLRGQGEGIALVPTMGYLHEGHLSLIRQAAALQTVTVVSIFVNPRQFGPGEDFERYPRNMERDCRLAKEAGAEIVFAPAVLDMYPHGYETYVELEKLPDHLCGLARPGHFRGVATVVLKLFNIVRPDVAVFGEKDYQQLVIIRRMSCDLDLGIDIVGCPLVREADGLALSSRNAYLSMDERKKALALYRALKAGREIVEAGERSSDKVRTVMRDILEKAGIEAIEYVSVSNPDTLEEVDIIYSKALLALAARVGKTRLIDNFLVLAHNK